VVQNVSADASLDIVIAFEAKRGEAALHLIYLHQVAHFLIDLFGPLIFGHGAV